jgi:hypothetical protein
MDSLVKEHPLIEGLKATGTGDYYLRPARELVARNAKATDREVAQALIDAGRAYHITAEKALKLCHGKSPRDLEDPPPPNMSEERAKHDRAELARLFAQELGQRLEGKLADPNKVVNPQSDAVRQSGGTVKTTPAKSS